ncbi:MAG: PIN domain-containing protein [Deltaproteobacteria bacterium]|nr:PIN domain-containing protein [Deltaproteobacteria bacterium]
MIAVDTNVLVYAHRPEVPQHAAARRRLRALAEGRAQWAIPVFCLAEFVRVVTHPRLFDRPHAPEEAAAAVERLMQSPSLRVLHPGARFVPLFAAAVRESAASGNLAYDAAIVALCREAGVRTLLTEDRDFARFDDFPVQRL